MINGTIHLRAPNGAFYTTGTSNTIGRINNRTQELAGPLPAAGGYNPAIFNVATGEAGVWEVYFIGPTNGTDNPPTTSTNNINQQNDSGYIAAFDVTVRKTSSNIDIPGRAYMNVFAACSGGSTANFGGIFHVLTKDGYTYEVDANGFEGQTFVFFANNKGYKTGSADSDPASYLSVNSISVTNLKNPLTEDSENPDGTDADVTHKLFFNNPASDLPLSADIRTSDGLYYFGTAGEGTGTPTTTWLLRAPNSPEISEFKFTGKEGTANQGGASPLGGNITFEVNQPGTYELNIDINQNGVFTDAVDRHFTGAASEVGLNTVYWDGLNGLAAKVANSVIFDAASVQISLVSGEVHFPLIDVEDNDNGLIITRTNGLNTNDIVYWDDSGTGPGSGGTELGGSSSATAGHDWTDGDGKGLDTWAYVASAVQPLPFDIQLKEADLVVSLSSNKATYCIGETITYTLAIQNDGPDDVTGAKVAFSFPSELTITGITAPITTGITFTAGTNNGPIFTDDPITATLDMINGAELIVTITATIDSEPTGTLDARATILRPADVTDPDATNPDAAEPSDPLTECAAGTGCVNNNIANHSATVSVSDISITATSASKSEGNSVGSLIDMTFTVSLSAANNGCSVTVDYDIDHDLTDASDFDFTSTPASGTLTFAPGETSKVLTFKVKQDLMVEGDETFSVVLSNPSSGGQIITASATGTIDNDDTITQIEITKVDGAEGGANGSFTFTFPGGASFDVDTPVPYTLTGTAAGSGTDYTATGTAGTITIPAGSNSVTLDLTVNNDALTEGNETVIITPGTIGNVYNSSVTVTTPVPVVTIADNDPATITISGASITEGDSGPQDLTFNVTLSNPTGSAFSINYATADGTALAGEDYVAKTSTLNFTGIAETQTITIQVNGDQKIEQNEAFTIALGGLTNAFSGQLTVVGSPATGTITDNDNTPANRIITITSTDGQELGPLPGVFTFSFPAGVSADQPTTIDFGLTGVAGATDYTSGATSVIIPAGVTSGTFSLTVLGDDILEGPESVILTTTGITNTDYATTLGNTSQTLNIIDDDAANIITGVVTVTEGDNGLTDMIFNVQLDKATGSGFTIDYTISDGTALAGEDYTTASGLFTGTLTFSGAVETQQIIVQVNGDQKIEVDETLTLTLGTPSNTFDNDLAVQFSPATGTITDDDNDPLNKIITITKADGYEGIPGSEASFTFSLPNGVSVDSDTEISYTLTGSATGGAVDYTGSASGTIRIFAGQNSATLDLPVVDDIMLEGDETVIVTVDGTSNPAYDPFTVSNSGLSLDIIENDNTVLLSSAANVVEGNSGTKTIEFKVTVALATSLPFTVDFHTTNGTALAVEDYIAQSGTMSFAANTPNQVQSIFVTINGDLKIENDETFTVTLDGLSENFGNTLSVSPPVTMTITDDDDIPANKIISISKTNGAEPGTDGTFTLSFPTGVTSDAATTVNYILSGTAQAGGIDYFDTELTPIMIPAGENSVTLSMVDVVDDLIIEGTESVLMTITSVTNTSYTGFAGNTPVALDITDNDNTAANNVITLSNVSNGGEPGTQAQFMVSFPPTITASVPTTVNYTVSGTAASGLDYTALSGSVVIPAGYGSATIDVLVINDQVIEDLEQVELTLTSATNSISTLTVGPGMVSADITDDDNIASNNVITLTKVVDGAEPGTEGQFKVSFPTGITSAVDTEVSYTVDPASTASAGTDYTALSGTVTILAGNNSALIDVEVIDDQVIENPETVLLALSSATNTISLLTVQPANLVGVIIADNDNTVGNNIISINSITNASEPAANGLFTVSYPTGISSSEATLVTYTISGTAVNGTDYTTIPFTVTIPANTNSVDIDIEVFNDQIIEPTETVGLTLTLANNTSFSPTVNGTLADIDVVDDDNNPTNNRIILNAITGGSEPATPGQFTVGFPAGFTSSEQTIVNYLTSGTATSGADYTALTGTIIIPANSGPVPINIAVLDDNIIEGTETVAITLDNATNSIIGSLATLPSSAVSINIEDDEDDDLADNIITLTSTNGGEPGNNPTFVVSYPSGITSSKDTEITYTIGGTAIPGTDYTALSGTATILAGSNFATILVPVIDDQIIELTETVELTINSANNNISALTWLPLTALSANIADDDNTLTNNTITLSKVIDGTEPTTSAQFMVSFPSGFTSSAETTVDYTVGGTAVAGTDYTALTGTVIIPANSNSALIDVLILDDLVIEPTETVSLTLTGATNANAPMAISPDGSAVIADIEDDDNNTSNNNIYLSLVQNGVEGAVNPQFEVSFPAGYSSSEPTIVTYAPSGVNTAVLNLDYTVPLTTVTIPAYTNSALIDIPLTNDLILEPTESFRLVLTGASNTVAAGLAYQTSSESADIEDNDNVAANNVITITKVSDGVEAGTPAVFNVSFPAGYTNSVATTVNYVVSGGTALEGTDFTIIGQVVIPAGSGSANLDVTLIDDQILEATETIQLTLVDATNSIFTPITVNPAPAIADIADDDSAVAANREITITPDDGAEVTLPGIQNPGSFTFQFPMGITASAPTEISYVLSGTAGGNGADFTGTVSGTVTIPAGDNGVSISFPVSDDDMVENNETIILTSGSVSNIHVTGISVDNSPSTLNITDNDAATLTVNNVTVTEGNSGDTEVEFTVTLDKATGGSFSINYTTGDLSATAADNDYNQAATSLSFSGNAGETVKFIVHVNGDEKIEGDEIFNVNFSTPTNTFNGRLTMPVPTATGTITNDDSGTITITSAPGSENNPNPNGASFTFSFPPGVSSDQPTTIYFGLSVGSTATITDDYIFPDPSGSGWVTIPAGATSATVPLPVVDDAILENTENIILTVGSVLNPYPARITTPTGTATTTIIDNDVASVSLSTPLTVNENAGTATFTVTLTGDVQEAFTVVYSTSDIIAQAPGDYTAITNGAVTFLAGSVDGTSVTFQVTITDDNLIELGEAFRATLTSITGLATIGTAATAATTITDNDNSMVALTWVKDGSEPNTDGQFKVAFPSGVTSTEDVTVTYTVGGTATNGTDYALINNTVVIPAGQESALINVDVTDDELIEVMETVRLTLTGASSTNFTHAVQATPVNVNITDDDNSALSLSWVKDGAEPNVDGQLRVSFPSGVTSTEAVTVTYSIGGTAINGTDYASLGNTVVIPAGSNEAFIDVDVTDDQLIEQAETVIVTLTGAVSPSFTHTVLSASQTVTIADNDNSMVTLSVVNPGGEPVTDPRFRVGFPSGVTSTEATTVAYSLGGTATSGSDYAVLSGTVVIPAGQEFAFIDVDVVDDQVIETTEQVTVTLTGAVSTSFIHTVSAGTLSADITDNDNSMVTLSWVKHGGEPGVNGQFRVAFPAGVTSTELTTIAYTVSGTATSGTDYTALSGTVTIPAGSNEALIDVDVTDDQLTEVTEQVTLRLVGAASTSFTHAVSASAVSADITDDDLSTVTLSWVSHGAEPGTDAQFKVSFPSGVTSTEATTVSYAVGGIATPGVDYTTLSGTVVIPAGEESALIDVDVLDDQLIEPTETVVLNLTGASSTNFTHGIAGGSVNANITDNDNSMVTLSWVKDGEEPNVDGQFKVAFPAGVTSTELTTITYTVSGSATNGTDYAPISNTVVIPMGSNEVLIDVDVTDDQLREITEQVTLTLTGAGSTNFTHAVSATAVSADITDNDNGLVSLSLESDGGEPGTPARFKVSFPAGMTSTEATTVTYTIGGTASNGTDYATLGTAVVIPAGSEFAWIDVDVTDDALTEVTETVIVTLTGAASTNFTHVVQTTAEIADITDNDNNGISLAVVDNGSEPNTDGQFKVAFPSGVTSTEDVTVTYTVGGTATNGTDYALISNTVVIPAGQESALINVDVTDDELIEVMETVRLTLTGAVSTNFTHLVQATPVNVTITDDDNSALSLSWVKDGAEPNVDGQLKVSFPSGVTSTEAVTVSYSIGGTAINGTDYASLGNTVVIPAGSNEAFIDVDVTDDQLIEQAETVIVTLTGALSTNLTYAVQTAPETVDIGDDDNSMVTLSVVNPGGEPVADARFQVAFPSGVTSTEATTVSYTIGGNALNGTDYALLSGTVVIPAGQEFAYIDADVIDDQVIETTEQVTVTLTGAVSTSFIHTVSAGTLSADITDNDNSLVTLSWVKHGGEPGVNGQFKVAFPAGVTSTELTTITYTIAGNAVNGTDYATLSGTVTIAAGSNEALIDVDVTDDQLTEVTEQVTLRLVGAASTSFTHAVSASAVSADITDDDLSTVTLSWVSHGAEPGTDAQFKVSFPSGVTSTEATTVSYAVGGIATPGVDYTTLSGTVVIPAGEESALIDVDVLDDQLIEPTETVVLNLLGAVSTNFTHGVAGGSVNADITDNDMGPVTLSLASNGAEPTMDGQFKISLPDGLTSTEPTIVNYTIGGTATAGTDYTALSGTATILAGQNDVLINIDVIDDQKIELTETVELTLTNAGSTNFNYTVLPAAAVRADITDNDLAVAGVALTNIQDGAEPGTDAQFKVSLTGGVTSSENLIVNYSINGSASNGVDYTALSGSVTVPAGSTEVLIHVDVLNDALVELNPETVELTLTSASSTNFTIPFTTAPISANIADDDLLSVTLSRTANGGEPGTHGGFKVSFPAGVSSTEPTVVTYFITGNATANVDYTAFANSVTIPAGANSALIDIAVLDDDLIEITEQVTLTLTGATSASFTYPVLPAASVSVDITDNDLGPVTLSRISHGAEPGTNAGFRISLPAGITSTEATIVNYTIGGTATAGADYTALSGTATIAAGQNEVLINVDVIDDQQIEVTETVELTLTSAGSTNFTYAILPAYAVSADIADNDQAAAQVVLTKVQDGAEPGTDAQFKVTLTGGVTSSEDIAVQYDLGGSASNGLDYTTLSGSVTIAAGSTEALININVLDEQLVENTETVELTLSSASSSNFNIPVNTTTISADILDDDLLSVTLTRTSHGAEPGTHAGFKVSFPAGVISTEATIVSYTVAGTATAGTDYTALSGTVSIPAGANEALIDIAVLDDDLIETTEQVTLTLTNATSTSFTYPVLPAAAVSADITDDDTVPVTLSHISHGAETGTDAQFRISLPAGITSTEATIVNYTIGGTATAGADYTALSGTATILAGQNEVLINVDVIDDQIIEVTETVELTLISAGSTNFTYAILPASAVSADIADNDMAPVTLSRISHGAEPGTDAQFKVSFPAGTTSTVATVVNYTIGGSAAAGSDYSTLSGTVTIPAGSNSALIDVEVLNDTFIESTESVELTLTDALSPGLTNTVQPGMVSADITDDDVTYVTLSRELHGAEPGTNARFKVSLPANIRADEDITINYTIAGSASAGIDYTTLSGTATIPAGSGETFIDIEVLDDQIVEVSETVILTLTSAGSPNFTFAVLPGTAVSADIIDDESGQVILTHISDGAEPGTGAQFKVSLPVGMISTEATVVNYTVGGTATAGIDYTALSGTVTIPAGSGMALINVAVLDDQLIELTESVELMLNSANSTNLAIPVNSGTVRAIITDNDMGPLTLSRISHGGEPGTNARFKVSFPGGTVSSEETIVNYTIGGTASAGSDYTALTGTILIPAGSNGVVIDVPVMNDDIIEATETVEITLSSAASTNFQFNVLPATALSADIIDDDKDQITLSQVAHAGEPGTDGQFRVSLPAGMTSNEAIAVNYTIGGTATAGSDYTALSGTVIIPAGRTEAFIDVEVTNDQLIEITETVELTLTSASSTNYTIPVAPGTPVTVDITDDDIIPASSTVILSKISDGAEPLTNAGFKVSFQNPGVSSSEPIEVLYTISGDAGNGTDYSALNGVVTIPAGSNEAFINIEVIDDVLIEQVETVTLTLVSAGSANIILPVQPESLTANINDNDQIVLTVSNPSVTEGNNGTVTLTFNAILSTETPGGFTVNYHTSDGTATVADNDYTAVNGTWNFTGLAGETHSVSVTVNGDRKIERDELFNLVLDASDTFDGRLVIIESPATGTILDDDNIPENKKVTITKTDGAEGAYNGSITFSLPQGITMDSPTIIPFVLAGTAFSGQDYIVLYPSPVAIPAGINSITIPVPVRDDAIMEGTETIRLLPGIVKNGRYNGITVDTPVPVLEIFDNDFSFLSISSPVVKEGDAGGTLITFEVTLSSATATGFFVDYTTEDNTATLDDKDYNFSSGTVVFDGTAGEVQTIHIWVNSDINVEDDENFRIVLSGLSKTFENALRIGSAPGIGTILNDDVEPVASEDIIVTNEDTPVTSNILDNDTDYDGTMDPESIAIVTMPVNGILVANLDGTVTYTPELNYTGKDSFTYTAKDNTGIVTEETEVTIVVRPVNDAPEALDDEFYVLKNGSLNAEVGSNDADLDGDDLSFTLITPPAHGRLTTFNRADGTFIYVPDPEFTGIDHFEYQACDPPGACAIAQVTLYVQPRVTVNLTPAAATILEGELIRVTAEIGEPLLQDIELILGYGGSAEIDADYKLEDDFVKIVIPAGETTTTQQLTVRTAKDYLKEGDELVQVRVTSAEPAYFVTIGMGSDITITDFYPKDQELDEDSNKDINPDPLTSPNGDGLGNEKFIIHNIERYPDNEVMIFNRWGNKVYQTRGYDNYDNAFAGVANTGLLSGGNTDLPDGVYYYVIYTKDSAGASKINKGYFIVKR